MEYLMFISTIKLNNILLTINSKYYPKLLIIIFRDYLNIDKYFYCWVWKLSFARLRPNIANLRKRLNILEYLAK